MLYVKDHKTQYMFDPFDHLGPKRKKLLEGSWAQVFRDSVLPSLPVTLLAKHFDPIQGRPTNELFSMMGAMILQQMHDLSDDDTAAQFAFNIQWHYALDITNSSDSDAYVCSKSLWSIRHIMTENNLYLPLFEAASKKIAQDFKVDTDKQRIDSVHICSNMRHLGRIGLFVKTIKKFLTNLKRHHKNVFTKLGKEFTDRYLTKQGEGTFSMVKPSQSAMTLESLSKDLFFLVERFTSNSRVVDMTSYQLLVRLLKEQCIVEQGESADAPKVCIKANKDVPSDSLQSPSDPDAGYSGHKGKGYQVQVMETYSADENNKQLSLITHVEVEPAHKSDANALIPAIESAQKRDLGPKEVLADTLYGSDDNHEEAKTAGVELIAPTMGTSGSDKISLKDFTLTETGAVRCCPQGNSPISTKHSRKRQRHTAVFSLECCLDCCRFECCPVKRGKKDCRLGYYDKAARVAKRKVHEQTDEFREKYRFRAGVEATMSEYDRKTGVKRLRVRGLKAVSFAATLKAAAINILRAAAFKKRQKKDKMPPIGALSGLGEHDFVFKEQFLRKLYNFVIFFFHFKQMTNFQPRFTG